MELEPPTIVDDCTVGACSGLSVPWSSLLTVRLNPLRYTVVNDLQVRSVSGQGKTKEGKRSVESAGDARMSKKTKKGHP